MTIGRAFKAGALWLDYPPRRVATVDLARIALDSMHVRECQIILQNGFSLLVVVLILQGC